MSWWIIFLGFCVVGIGWYLLDWVCQPNKIRESYQTHTDMPESIQKYYDRVYLERLKPLIIPTMPIIPKDQALDMLNPKFRRYESLVDSAKNKEYFCRYCGAQKTLDHTCKYCGGKL